ncbi:outer membrane lipoprotein carrier protein LolA [Tenacibaculum sp. SG-28]|uniref:LolA family protein n=1 Tax=Tenacibaculum sp. SG-28 TaxID=754426 RepID=UPI000CF5143F|nr:outer membrane lipoprotein carrier protein LolA [Tenacibaculum sp. SG-28]PQJ23555.1 hypothetical protein BSU00_02665 [Tenacibaculum sp. SG-28]
MKKIVLFSIALFIGFSGIAQDSAKEAKQLLDKVSQKMGSYTNMFIGFTSVLENKEAGITDEAPIKGTITISGEKYNLDYLGNNFLFDGKNLAVINHDEKEITISNGDMEEEDGFIYPSKLLTFYNEGYNYTMGKLTNQNGRRIQYVDLTPIDSNSEVIKVKLGIDAKSNHIYKLVQIGTNGAETTFTITKFNGSPSVSDDFFKLNKEKYKNKGYYID